MESLRGVLHEVNERCLLCKINSRKLFTESGFRTWLCDRLRGMSPSNTLRESTWLASKEHIVTQEFSFIGHTFSVVHIVLVLFHMSYKECCSSYMQCCLHSSCSIMYTSVNSPYCCITYSTTFLSRIIFTFFTNWPEPHKLSPTNLFLLV